MTGNELKKLAELRQLLRGTTLFAFEKDAKFFLYRQINDGRNLKVLVSCDIDTFVRRATKAASGS